MYTPKQIGIPGNSLERVIYQELAPPTELQELIYCTWELRTTAPLINDFRYLVLPDLCVDIIFDINLRSAEKAIVMVSHASAEEINLGKSFHYAGIRFFPGVLTSDYILRSKHPMASSDVWRKLCSVKTEAQRRETLLDYVVQLLSQGDATKNRLMYQVISHSNDLHTVGDIEALTGYTRRQLQRIFRAQTNLSPRDFLKTLRFQYVLNSGVGDKYADQSHLIKEFKRITGLTPTNFKSKY